MRAAIFCALLLLAGCGANEPKEGALSADEERQLNDAAAMLDEPGEKASGEDGNAPAEDDAE